jgi:hypothetical protein
MLTFEKNAIERSRGIIMGCIRKYIECLQFNDLIIARTVSSRKLQAARWKFTTVMTHRGRQSE